RTLLTDCSIVVATMVRRSAVLAVGGFDQDMELGHEDWDLWLSLARRGFTGAIIPEVLFYNRVRPRSRSSDANRLGLYLQLYRQRIRKHLEGYERFLLEVLCDMEDRNLSLYRHTQAKASEMYALEASPAGVRVAEEILHGMVDRSPPEVAPARAALRHGL